jgi:MoxR-like ATPase
MPEIQPVMSGEDILEMQRFARSVPIPAHVKEYAARVVLATHPETQNAPEASRRYIRFGSSPRGCQTIVSAAKVEALRSGKSNAGFEDVRKVVTPALRHRIILNFEGEAEGITPDEIIASVVKSVPELPAEVEQIISDR